MAQILPAIPIYIIIFILSIIIIGLFIWALIMNQQLRSLNANVIQNPFCLRTACIEDGTHMEAFQLNDSNDPQRKTYQTVNYCTANAPPQQFQEALNVCEFGSDPVMVEKFEEFLAWYPFSYTPSCGNSWRDINVKVANQNLPSTGAPKPPSALTDPNNPASPNNPYFLNGQNDNTSIYALRCAKKLNLPVSAGYRELHNQVCQNLSDNDLCAPLE